MTRWHELDLTGQILQSSEERKGSDKWEVIELPALYDDGEPLWPDFWSKEELTALKAELPISKKMRPLGNERPQVGEETLAGAQGKPANEHYGTA
jgi:hypothetical protein